MLKTRFKTALIISIFLITAFSMLMCGCERKHGEFYTLQEAYDNGMLTKENLEEIAYYVNDQLKYPEELDSKVEKKIKNDMAYEIRHAEIKPIENAKPEGIYVVAYYGNYSGYYVVRIRSDYRLTTTDVPSYWVNIGGVDIHIRGHEVFYVWKNK